MNILTHRGNGKGKHQHMKQVLISKIIAMPRYPGYDGGNELPKGTFHVSEFLKVKKGKRPTKIDWDKAVALAEQFCQTFIDSKPEGQYWMMRKGIKTSYRYMAIQPKQ